MSTANPSANERVTFRSDQHATNLCEKLLSFYKNKELFDTVLITARGVKIHANKNVLSATSEYFLEKYRGGSKVNQVKLKEIDETTLKTIVDFMYSGSVELNLTNSESILKAATFLKIKILVDGCCDFIENNINTSNCLKWLTLSKEQKLLALRDKSLEYTYANFEKVSKQKELLQLNEIQLKDLLFNGSPQGNRDFEELAFLAMVGWIQHDKVNREKLTFGLLQRVCYQSLTSKFIIENRKSVCNTVESSDLVFKWQEWHDNLETQSIEIKKEAEEQEQEQASSSLLHQNKATKRRKEDPKLAVVLSCTSHSQQIITFQTYNTTTNSWSIQRQTPLRKMRTDFSMIAIDDKLIIVGGKINGQLTNSVEYLDLHTFKWSDLPPTKETRGVSHLVDLNGQLGVYSGFVEVNICSDSLEIYSFLTRKWTLSQSFPFPIRQLFHYNGKAYIFDTITNIHSCDPSTGKWNSTAHTINLIPGSGFALFGGFLFIIGGYDAGLAKSSVKRYNISNNTWCEVAPLPRARFNIKTTVFEGGILVFGGYPEAKWVDKYNPSTNTWMTFSSLAMAMPQLSSVICTLPSEI